MRIVHTASAGGADSTLRLSPHARGRGYAGEPAHRTLEVRFRCAVADSACSLPASVSLDGKPLPRLPKAPTTPSGTACWWSGEEEPGSAGRVRRAVVTLPRVAVTPRGWLLEAKAAAEP